MKQRLIIKHLSSWSPMVQKLLQHVAYSTTDPVTFPINSVLPIVMRYTSRLPKGLYEYEMKHEGNTWTLHEDGDLVLVLELIEIHELKTNKNETVPY